ncbi:sensor histidine kinase [Halosegnis marinus]|uniref:sensor histidine kinase n=1 Tax=Halosegnis marinus TaxID=3034023 RepID=UPI0036102E8F
MNLRRVSTGVGRLLAAGSLAATGLLVVVPNALALAAGQPLAGTAVASLGTALGLVVVAASAVLYRADISTRNVARVAAWNLLGLVVLGAVLLLSRSTIDAAVPLFLVASVLAVSSFAHLVIGVHDVLRIRAGELARERERLSVVNTLLRHNLRNEAQLLLGLAGAVEDAETRERIEAVGDRLGDLNDKARELQRLLDEPSDGEARDLSALVAGVVSTVRERHPDATFETAVPDGVSVAGDERLERVVRELVENAAVHAGDAPTVTVSATVEGAGSRWPSATTGRASRRWSRRSSAARSP